MFCLHPVFFLETLRRSFCWEFKKFAERDLSQREIFQHISPATYFVGPRKVEMGWPPNKAKYFNMA